MVIPEHIAIIMDGNGRWAKSRGLPRAAGHRAGVEALRQTVRAAGDLGVGWLTIYAFSSENWSRPQSEITDLMGLLKLFVRRDLAELHQSGVRVRMIGDRVGLEPEIRDLIREAEALTRLNDKLNLVIAFNYGGRDEIARAARAAAEAALAGDLGVSAITAEKLGEFLDTKGIPDPDLLIRTSGEKRLSNFLLWQSAHTEMVFLPSLWPDFSRADMMRAIEIYSERERRFGGLKARDAS